MNRSWFKVLLALAAVWPVSVAVDPTAKFFYVANIDSNDISACRIDSNGP
jgi:DNA-binding beta-propeller fold protein YncE